MLHCPGERKRREMRGKEMEGGGRMGGGGGGGGGGTGRRNIIPSSYLPVFLWNVTWRIVLKVLSLSN